MAKKAKEELEIFNLNDIKPVEFTKDELVGLSVVDSTGFEENFRKMYEITGKILDKIISKGKSIKDDSYVVREEFGECLAAGYRYLKLQTEVGKETRAANHEEDKGRDYETEMYKEIADVFMMTTTFCRHNDWDMTDRAFVILRPIDMPVEKYLLKVSEVLYRISMHYNGYEINKEFIYEFLEETFVMMIDHKDVLSNKITSLYNKIFKVIE